MFLNQLNNEQKEAFISLGVHASNANNDFAKKEKEMLQEYCKEMGIVFFDSSNTMTMDKIVEIFKDSDVIVKRIVLLEILGLLLSDGSYDKLENTFIVSFVEKIGLSQNDIDKEKELLYKYLDVYKEVSTAIYL